MWSPCRCGRVALPVILTAVVSIAGPSRCPAAGAVAVDTEFGLLHDDNISRADHGTDTFEDYIATISATLAYRLAAGRRGSLSLRGGLDGHQYLHWDELSRLRLGGVVEYRFQPRAGYTAVWYALTLAAAYAWHRDSAIRDAAEVALGASAGKRLTDRIAARAGYAYELARASDGAAFDTDRHRVFADLDYTLSEPAILYGGIEWRDGEVVSTAAATPAIRAMARAAETDEVFSTATVRRVAYRLNAETLVGRLGVNYALSNRTAFDVTALYHSTRGKGDNDYRGLIVGASLLLRF